MKYISFIVPVYNVGPTQLSRCIDSIYECGIHRHLFEIIVVDDASPKWESELKCLSKYPKLKVISHSKNLKLGAARNTGVKEAVGKYVWFVDSDDYLVKGSVANIMPMLNSDLDIIQFGAYYQKPNGEVKELYINSSKSVRGLGLHFIDNPIYVPACSWSKLYRLKFLRTHKISHPEGVYYEDQEFLIKSLLKAMDVKIITDKLYVYSVGGDSIMNAKPDLKHTMDRYRCVMECKYLLRKVPSHLKSKRLANYKEILDEVSDMENSLSKLEKLVFKLFKLKYKLPWRKKYLL